MKIQLSLIKLKEVHQKFIEIIYSFLKINKSRFRVTFTMTRQDGDWRKNL